jgi:hypothetical protein
VSEPIPLTASARDSRPRPAVPEVAPADAAALHALLRDAPPGRAIAYHVGALARDRYPNLSKLPEARRRALDRLAAEALRLAEAGRVSLIQRRLGEERFLYLLVVRRPTRSAARPPAHRVDARSLREAA